MQSSKNLASPNPNSMTRARTHVSALTDRLKYGRANVVKLCDMGKKQCRHLSSLL
jgi:hypothetical protein